MNLYQESRKADELSLFRKEELYSESRKADKLSLFRKVELYSESRKVDGNPKGGRQMRTRRVARLCMYITHMKTEYRVKVSPGCKNCFDIF